MSHWFPLHCHSTHSLLDGLSKPEQIAERIVELGYAGSALTDHGAIHGCPGFMKAMSGACRTCGKQKAVCRCEKYEAAQLKAILGEEFYICQQDATIRTVDNASLSHLCVLAKSPQGWKNLMKASSASSKPEFSYRKPRLDLDRLASFSEGEFIVFSGHMGSDLANCIFTEPKLAYNVSSAQEAKALAHKDWPQRVFDLMERYQTLFGKDNFFVEIQLIDAENLPAAAVVAEGLRWAAKKKGVPRIATADSHYCRKEDAFDQRVLLCTAMDTTLKEVQRKLDNAEDVGLGTFFKSNNYHIPSLEEMRQIHTSDELENAVKIGHRCENYSIGGKPLLPVFDCPNGQTPDEHLMELCLDGWKRKVVPVLKEHPEQEGVYHARLHEKEYPVLTEAGLSSYFLIVQDYIKYAINELRCKVGKGRGSGAGCLVSHLLDITNLDPIQFSLFFERFYSDARNMPAHISFSESPFEKFSR